MCKTTTPPQAAPLEPVRNQPANSSAGAVIPLQSYLDKYVGVPQFAAKLIPATRPTLPADVDPNAYKRVAFSLLPLLADAPSSYYAGVFDDDTDFSASLVKVAALFAAGQLLAEAKAALPGASSAASFFTSFNAAVQAEINANADPRVLNAHFSAGSAVGLMPKISNILKVTPAGSGLSVDFADNFKLNQSQMIIPSDDSAAAFCIDRLGYGYISTALNEKGFFDSTLTPGPALTGATGRGIWLAADYGAGLVVRIPCVNDHPDGQNTTARQMCRLFSMIRLKQLPENDLETNTLMQTLLGQAGTWLQLGQHIQGVHDVTVAPLFSRVHAKVGVAGLGTIRTPNVYSEGLIIKWNGTQPDGTPQIDFFNNKIDPGNANLNTRLSGEIAVCWQNLLAQILPTGFDGIVEVLNHTLSDFLQQVPV